LSLINCLALNNLSSFVKFSSFSPLLRNQKISEVITQPIIKTSVTTPTITYIKLSLSSDLGLPDVDEVFAVEEVVSPVVRVVVSLECVPLVIFGSLVVEVFSVEVVTLEVKVFFEINAGVFLQKKSQTVYYCLDNH
jgi:hypothetical protein